MSDHTAKKIQAAIYARVSTEEQREGQTIDSQIAELERFARDKQWPVAGVYKDEGWSGGLLARPSLDRLRDDASRQKFSLVLINDVDRLARDVAHLGIIKRDLERCGVDVVFKKLPAEKSPTYNLMVNILGSFAEFEREMISDRTRRGRRHKVEVRQQFLGTIPSYGYRYILRDRTAAKEGYLEIVPDEVAVVRQMYDWVGEEGLSIRKVADRLNERGIPARKGKTWGKSSVGRVLHNETYAGVWHYNKHYGCEPLKPTGPDRYKRSLKSSRRLRARSEWLPVKLPTELQIIERAQWEQVQKQITSNTAFSPRNTKHFYLLRGLVKCGGCGGACVGDPNHGKFYYRCRSCRKFPIIRENRLDDVVWAAVEEAILKPSIISDQVSKYQQREESRAHKLGGEREEIERALRQLSNEETRIIEAYRMGIISPAQLGQELEGINSRKSAAESRKASLGASPADILTAQSVKKSVAEYCRQAAERLQEFTLEERQRFLRLIVNKVIYEGEQVRIRGIIPILHAGERTLNHSVMGGKRMVEAFSGFATTMFEHSGRNPVRHFSFELVRPLPGKPFSLLSDEGQELLHRFVKEQPGATLWELCDMVQAEREVSVSISQMHRAMRGLGYVTDRQGSRPGVWQSLKRAA